jgi:acetyl-CoA C-acetyltransferase
MDRDVVIVAAVRTPFSKFGGALRDWSTVDLSAFVFRHLLERVNLAPSVVDEVYLGLATVGEAAMENGIVARQALLKAGFPPETVSMTVDRACCSSFATMQLAARAIRLGEADVVVAAGADNMGRQPFYLPADVRWGWRRGPLTAHDNLHALGYRTFNPVALDTGCVALEFEVSRAEQDAWAARSHQRYAQAAAAGRFKDEIVPVPLASRKGPKLFDADELPRPDTTAEGLSALPTIYGSATVTAGNAPGLDTGASALLLMSRARARRLGTEPLAEVLVVTSVATAPERLPVGPAMAIEKALGQTGVSLEELELLEVNEAFAAVPLVAAKMLAKGDGGRLAALHERLNVNGGAVAIGHPVGASGGRIVMTMMYELRRRGARYGAAAICGGLAQADAAILRVLARAE